MPVCVELQGAALPFAQVWAVRAERMAQEASLGLGIDLSLRGCRDGPLLNAGQSPLFNQEAVGSSPGQPAVPQLEVRLIKHEARLGRE